MAARSRPRAGQLKEEIDEERSIWNQIRADALRVDQLLDHIAQIQAQAENNQRTDSEESEQQSTLWKAIQDLGVKIDAKMAESDVLQQKILDLTKSLEGNSSPSTDLEDELEKTIRRNVKITNEIKEMIQADGGDNDILTNLAILSALRESTGTETSRSASVGKSHRDRQKTRRPTDTIEDRESVSTNSPGGPSPKMSSSSSNLKDRLLGKSSSSRAGSVPAAREGSVKPDDDKDDSRDPTLRARLTSGTEVLYRNNVKNRSAEGDGEGILCRITTVIGEGKQRRYEIIDLDPDLPHPAVPYRASVNHLVAIPPPAANATLPELPAKRNVLALYPATTTFYKAQVVAAWGTGRAGGGKVKREGEGGIEAEAEKNLVRLRFEGEDEADREMSVERRYVLPDK